MTDSFFRAVAGVRISFLSSILLFEMRVGIVVSARCLILEEVNLTEESFYFVTLLVIAKAMPSAILPLLASSVFY